MYDVDLLTCLSAYLLLACLLGTFLHSAASCSLTRFSNNSSQCSESIVSWGSRLSVPHSKREERTALAQDKPCRVDSLTASLLPTRLPPVGCLFLEPIDSAVLPRLLFLEQHTTSLPGFIFAIRQQIRPLLPSKSNLAICSRNWRICHA